MCGSVFTLTSRFFFSTMCPSGHLNLNLSLSSTTIYFKVFYKLDFAKKNPYASLSSIPSALPPGVVDSRDPRLFAYHLYGTLVLQ